MKLYTTSEFISNSNDTSFEKNKINKKNLTTKIKLYTTSNDISFEKNLTTINHFQSIHNSNVIKSV